MSPDRYTQRSCYALGAALALAASTALAQTSVPQQPVPEASVKADSTEMSLPHCIRQRRSFILRAKQACDAPWPKDPWHYIFMSIALG